MLTLSNIALALNILGAMAGGSRSFLFALRSAVMCLERERKGGKERREEKREGRRSRRGGGRGE